MSEDDALLKAVVENPADDAPRLIYADWLEEHGDSDRAEFIRVQCELGEWERVPNSILGRPREDRLIHRDGRLRDQSDPAWLRLLQIERELAERNWLTWLRPLTDIFRSVRSLQMASRPWRFVRRLIGRPDPELEFVHNPYQAPAESCTFRLPRLVLDKQNPLQRLALTRGFAGFFEFGSHVTADQMRNLLGGYPVEFLTLANTSAAVVATRSSRRVPLRHLSLMNAETTALRTILRGNSDFAPRRLTIYDRTCTADLAHLLAESPVVAELEALHLAFSGFNDGLLPAEAGTLTRNPLFRRLRNGSLTIFAGLQSNETVRILTDRFGPPQLSAGFGHEFRLSPAASSQSATDAPR